MAPTFADAFAKFAELLAEDTEDADRKVERLAQEKFNAGTAVEKGAACVAVAKLRLKSALLIHQSMDHPAITKAGEEALKLFQEAGEKLGEANALNVCAQSCLISDDLQKAIKHAKMANTIAQDAGDKKLIAEIQDTLCQAFMSQGNQSKALAAAKERVSLLKEFAKDSKVLADALGVVVDLSLKRGLKDAAAKSAQELEDIAKKIGDKDTEGFAKKSRGMALVAAGKEDDAPNRDTANQCLSICSGAVEAQNEERFQQWWRQAQETGAVSNRDVSKVLAPLRESLGEEELNARLAKVGAPFPWTQQAMTAMGNQDVKIHEFTKRWFYFNYRGVGNIQYGPRYQAVRAFRKGGPGEPCMATLRPTSQSESWEITLGYHTGILDGSLQTGSVATGEVF